MKRNQKGFTLIELLVVIALMLSILGIAIVSFINISNNKKKESWEDVKAQIETAATEYFTANEFLFEGLSGEVSGEISIGKLVSDDYLNKITNPSTGKSVSNCAIVTVTKNNNKLTATFDESSENSTLTNCDSDNSITVSEPGAPNITGITVSKLDDKNDPYNNWYHDGAKFSLNVTTGGNGAISSILSCKTTSGYCEATESNGDTVNYEPGTSYTDPNATVCFSVTNTSNKTSKKCETAKVDNSFPNCTVSKNPNTNGWVNKNVTITGKCSDTGSGCKVGQVTTTISGNSPDSGTTKSPGTVEDYVGHNRACNTATVYVDKTNPTCKLEVSSNNKMSNGWYLGKTTFTAKNVSSDVKKWKYYTDQWNKDTEHTYNGGDITGPNITSSGNRTVTVNLTDRAGNTGTCSKSVRLYNTCDEVTYKDGNTCTKTCGGGTLNQLAYDKYTGARCSSKDKTSGGAKCNTQSCYATSCSVEKIAGRDSDCTSSAGNEISAQVLVKCNGKIDYVVMQYYYPGASSSVCGGNSSSEAVCKQYPGGAADDSGSTSDCEKTVSSGNINGAVFNLRGCGVTKVEYRYKVVAGGKTIHNYGSYDSFSFSSSNGKSKLCDPDRGSGWFN